MTVGNDQLFEDTINKFSKIEIDPNKNVDEEMASSKQQRSESQAGKFGVFGYSADDINTSCTHYDTEEEAKAAAVELAQDINGKDLAYVEVWQADEEGRFGVSGKPIWKSDELATEESKTNEEEASRAEEVESSKLDKSTLEKLVDAWELIGTYDDDAHVRSMADEKVDEYTDVLAGIKEEVNEISLTSTKYVVTAQSHNRETDEPHGEPRDEEIDIATNKLFNGTVGDKVSSTGDIENRYEAFWNETDPSSEDIVKVISVKPVEESKIDEKKLENLSDAELDNVMELLSKVNLLAVDEIMVNVSSQMDKIADEIGRRAKEKED